MRKKYQIQYATNKKFKKAKSKNDHKTEIYDQRFKEK